MTILRSPGQNDEGKLKLPPAVAEALGGAEVKTAVRVEAARSSEKPLESEVDEQNDILELELEGGIRQYISVGQFREDYGIQPSRDAAHVLEIPTRIGHGEPSRGLSSDIILRGFRVVGFPLEKQAARKVAEHFESKIPEGLHAWKQPTKIEDAIISDPTSLPVDKPLLLFLHGTASSTLGSFGGLPQQQMKVWEELQRDYKDRVFAFEHATLTKSPADNIIELLEVIPPGARLHIVSHSRGGLLGELLCRADVRRGKDESRDPFDELELKQFAGAVYTKQKEALQKLGSLLKTKQPRVERFVRVACPAVGTVLASKRLDRFFSLLVTLLGKAGLGSVPGYDFVTALAMATAKERTNPRTLPGIEAMMPESPLVKVLNRPGAQVPADLSVIAGDIQGSGLWQRLMVFATDLFYWQDHDLVVHTRAMYGGAPRTGGARFFFDKGAHVSHFNYFRNKESADMLLAGLQREEGDQAGFKGLEPGPEPILRRTRRDEITPQGVVYVLPGIMGSELAANGNRVWLDPIDIARGKLADLAIEKPAVEPVGIMARSYGRLVDFLADRYEVITFPFDWRRSLLQEGRRLGGELEVKLAETALPVRIVAHSMGGLLLRAMIAERRDVWEKLKQSGGRVVMLGTPNRGSFAINNVLLGREGILRQLALLDFAHSQKEILTIIRRFRGLLELLPMDSADRDYFSPQAWSELHDAFGEDWVTPTDADLESAARLRDALSATDTVDPERMAYVAGKAPATPIAIEINEQAKGAGRIVVKATAEGDGRVTWETGIPRGVKAWYASVAHGSLANHEPAFPAIVDLLEHGETQRLPTTPPVARGSTTAFRMPIEEPVQFPDEIGLEASALGFEPEMEPAEKEPAIHVRIVHGDLRFARNPVLLGHYQGDSIVGAERMLDECVHGRLQQRRQLGLYPGPVGPVLTSAVVLDPTASPPGAIVVGLGEIGRLAPGDLRRTITRGLVTLAIESTERNPGQAFQPLSVTSLLVGSGEGGVSIQDSVVAILEAAREANLSLQNAKLSERVRIDTVELLELHLDRAVRVSKVLNKLQGEYQGEFDLSKWQVEEGKGGWRRVAYEEDKDWWTRLEITEREEDGALQFVSLTGHARAKAHMLPTQRSSLDALLRQTVQTTHGNEQLAGTLFELLVPNRIKDAAPQERRLVLQVDKKSARYPWELLRDGLYPNAKPLSVRSGMVRQMQTWTFRETVVSTPELKAFVVGDPPTESFVPLPGAKQEAEAVAAALKKGSFEVTAVIQRGFRKIIEELFARPYRVLHLAGHGVYEFPIVEPDEAGNADPQKKPKRTVTGMVLSDDVFLTPAEVGQLRIVPELVFINCCHLGKEEGERRIDDTGQFHKLAANVGTQLIEMGARAVVAAGWAVDDRAANVFATTFYQQMLEGSPFGQAVIAAREATWDQYPDSNTWGAYQCYGDPDYTLIKKSWSGSAGNDHVFAVVDEAIYEIDNISEQARKVSKSLLESRRKKLANLVDSLPADWKKDARMLEALGRAYGEVRQFEDAIDCYGQLRTLEEATFSIKALEQSANLRCRWTAELWQQSRAGATADAPKATANPVAVIDEAIRDIELLLDIGATNERLSLMGSAWKRKALVTTPRSREKALVEMAEWYGKAHDQALARDGKTDYYPALNWLAALVLNHWRGENVDLGEVDNVLDRVEVDIVEAEGRDLSFWPAIAELDAEVVRRLRHGDLDRDDHMTLLVQGYSRAATGVTAREFSTVLEHLEFLHAMLDEELDRPRKTGRKRLAKALRSMLDKLRPMAGDA